ncbi:MutS2 protein [Nitrospira sp. KM1]|uniref:endonuclease MutS2 n=1 Tax=Nitrospira sp. KM1 TaxID=1936990 RepID=UPI0013A7A792|nr:endonuclease MutS2 [Nitrospira sp. KM1]BCA56235.1 MutS2 protein [Nitrospira sp. KM1]
MNLFDLAKQVLEWDKLLEILALQARSSMGAIRCRSMTLAEELGEAQRRQQETMEMAVLIEGADPFQAVAFPDVRESLTRAFKGGVLDTHELRDQALIIALIQDTFQYIGRHRDAVPAIARFGDALQQARELRPVGLAIQASIYEDGSIKETATPELRRLTQYANGLKQQIRQDLDRILHSTRYAEALQEHYFDQREGRYVVPIKVEMQGRVAGIVHDVSSSGATVFIEPRELLDLNNAIKVADLEIDREIRKILRELSIAVANRADLIRACIEVLAELDEIMARAVFSRLLQANPVTLNIEGRVILKQARHPLLALSKPHIVPNDIKLDETIDVLIVSGPNTGGKTVTLKIVGLFALMARAGLLLPCAPGSEMAIFSQVYADIGDAQDLSRDLSSFSAHMTQMIQLLREARAARELRPVSTSIHSLVLLDEPATSTDPIEGAALAEALLCRLSELGMKVVATTHYQSLKALAQSTSGFANASVEFDVSTLSPTYRLFMGIPGGSSAIEIAGRLGMEDDLLDDARRRMDRDDRAVERMLEDLHAKQRRLSADLASAVNAREEADTAVRLAKEQLARLEATDKEQRKDFRKKLQEQFSRARAEVQATVDEVKRDQRLIKAREAKQRLHALEAQATSELVPIGEAIPLDKLVAGDRVEIGGLGLTGTLLEPVQGRKRVRVKVGEGELSATVSSLIGLPRESVALGSPRSIQHDLPKQRPYHSDAQPVVDVRGRAVDDALDEVVAALDRAILCGEPMLRIIHGHGTGKLKSALREYLKGSPYVQTFRAGDRSEGGDGVTVANLP